MNLLILLIGKNPIANFALITYFKKNGNDKIPKYDKVMLIYTDETKDVANNIKNLNKDVEFIDIDLENRESNLKYIQNSILENLQKIDNLTTIHLNYTGGRKPMSIGAFLAVENYNSNIKCQKIYSDISPKDYKLTLDDGMPFLENSSISENINISIKKFYLLHGLEIMSLQKDYSEFFSNEFCEFLLEKSLHDEEEFYINLWDRDIKELKELDWKNSIPKNIYDLEEISNKKLKKLQKFIKGTWLEEYIFDVLKEIKHETHITDVAWNIEAKNKDKLFEVDIIAISGYKSFVFSCTTDQKAHIKQKAFEGNVRAEQLAGIRVNTILVSLTNESGVNGVKSDMHHTEKAFHAIGAEDIQNREKLKAKLLDIFK